MGGFEHKDISSVFSEIDVLVVPSIWNENCPLTILEAFFAKTPVIASRIGGIPELVKDKENGLLFECGNFDDLYDKMETFINNPDLTARFKGSINPFKSIAENGWEIEELYRDLLNNH